MSNTHRQVTLGFLAHPTRFIFFTGKGGVGKTSVACATALALADRGNSVLIVSTDPASNLDEILGVPLSNQPIGMPGVERLQVLNIDPTVATEAYRARVQEQMAPGTTDAEREKVKEELSGACTTEIAAFDEFAERLADPDATHDYVIFDTAPTGHTLRLLSLPQAWSVFLEANEEGASCLGPHSGLKLQEATFKAAMDTLRDPTATTIMLVARPETGALTEAAHSSEELKRLGLTNQRLVINGVFTATGRTDDVAASIEDLGQIALRSLPERLKALPRDDIPLRPVEMVGLDALRGLFDPAALPPAKTLPPKPDFCGDLPGLDVLIDQLGARAGA